jgi:conjugal transfer pilus assembly protein TraK
MRKLASKFASALLIPTALLLASASPALALQVVEGSDGVSVDAVLSIKEATRIRVDGAPITNVFGNIYSTNCGATITTAVPPQPGASPAPATGMVNPAGEIVLECDVDKGEIYVRPVGGPGKPVNLFVSTQHATYTLLLRRSDTPADTIVIRDKTARLSRAEPSGATASTRTPQHVRALKGMLVAMAADRPPTDIRVDEVNRPIQLWQEAKFALVRLYEGRGLVGERYMLTNVSTQDMVLAEQEFDRERGGVLAVSIENHNLRPGESTTVYVIRQGS